MAELSAEFIQRLLDNGLAIFLILAAGWFLDRRVWSWFTQEFWPKRVVQHDEEIKAIRIISESLVALKMLSESSDRYHQDTVARMIRVEGSIDAMKVLTHSIFQGNEELLGKFKATDTIILGTDNPRAKTTRTRRKKETKEIP